MSVRSWFNSLSTGEERAAVSSITDPALLRLLFQLCSKSDREGNVPLCLEEITALYQQHSTVVTTGNGISAAENDKANVSDEPPVDAEPRTPMKKHISSTTGASCPPAFANASPCDSELSIKTEPPTPSAEDKISKLFRMLISHVFAMLPSAFSTDVGEIGKWLKNGDGSSNGVKKRNKGSVESKKSVSSEDAQLVALALDPTILSVLQGGNLLFYNLANRIIGLLKEEDDEEKGDGVERFLTHAPSDATESMWPAWLVQCSSKEQKQMNLGLFLLAGFEMSITASHQRSIPTVGDVMVHIGGESSLQKVWTLNPSSEKSDAASKLAKEVEQIFLFRTLLMEDGEKLRTLVSGDEWSQFESSFVDLDGAFKVEHLLFTPLQWLLSSSSAGESCRDWKNSINGIWSKIAGNLLHGECKTYDQKREDGRVEDLDIDGDTLASPTRKKKKKSKKKHKKKNSNLDANNKKEEDRKEQQTDPAKQSDGPVKKSDKALLPSANGNNSSFKAAIDKDPAKAFKASENQEKVNSTSNSSHADSKSDEAASKLAPAKKQYEPKPSSTSEKSESQANDGESKPNDDADEWETVAVKTRKPKAKQSGDQSNNNKSNNGNRTSQSSRNNNNNSSNNGEGGINRRRDKKKSRKDKGERDSNRRRNQPSNQTSVVKDVLTHILDVVDDEVSKRKQGVKSAPSDDRRRSNNGDKRSTATANNGRGNAERRKSQATPVPSSTDGTSKQQPRSLRDVVAGVTPTPGKSSDMPRNGDLAPAVEPPRDAKIKPGLSYKSVIEPARQQTPAVVTPTTTNEAKAPEKTAKAAAKENSKSKSASALVSRRDAPSSTAHNKTKGATPVVETEANGVAAKEDACQLPPSTTEEDRNTPPLSTLLGPGTSCSGTSSVASSLEAPHSSRFRHQSIASTEDVGVHLLNVCKQLSEEIDTFMSKRALALDVRRKERSAVLGALQDTLVKIWPGNCHVEMYGSCATQLDLPSSDLDLVVWGLDDMMMNHVPIDPATGIMPSPDNSSMNLHSPSPSGSAQNLQHQQSFENSSQKLHQSFENSAHALPHSPAEIVHEQQTPSQQEFNSSFVESNADEVTEFVPESAAGMVYDASEEDVTMGMEGYNVDYHGNQQEYYYVPYNYIPPMSLNAQRVIRLASELEMQPWAVQVKAIPTAAVPVVKMLADPSKLPGAVGTGDNWIIAAQAGAPGTPPLSPEQIPSNPSQFSSSSRFFTQPTMPSWRGADIMNGLQPVDITFEGPEHGGIGSTTYSACVVQDACNETGLSIDKTPVVQVKMVLKELLAQRRLNEPFTGGLSSYALLLLLLAVVKERQIIREEMERVEKQRQEVNQLDTQDNKPVQTQQSNNGTRLSVAQIVAGNTTAKSSNNNKKNGVPPTTAHASSKEKPEVAKKQLSSSSWASIAKKSNGSTARTDSMSTATISNSSSLVTKRNANEKSEALQSSSTDDAKNNVPSKTSVPTLTLAQSGSTMNSAETESEPAQGNITKTLPQSKVTPEDQIPLSSEDELKPPLIPQCSNDVLEVLCSGELTAGKLLMHFLLFYGQHFDAQSTLIDLNGTHHPEYGASDLEKLSPFVTRPPGGNIDPVTGMYSVDPIVVYDPLEGAMDHNVAKRCYCWNNVKWVFAQSYMTVSSIVETSGTSSKTATKDRSRREKKAEDSTAAKESGVGEVSSKEQSSASGGDIVSPILELLLSF